MARAFAVLAATASAAALVAPLAQSAQAPGAQSPSAQAPRRPAALKLASLAPLAVTGRGFAPRETVLVTYLADDGTSRLVRARATRAGAFRAAFKLRLGRCDSFTVRAFGAAGSRAVLQVERSCDANDQGPPKRPPKEKPTPGNG